MKYDYYCDPGHGWVKVKRKELERLGILNKITYYSYQQGEYVFLEEDCDAGTFIEAKTKMKEQIEFKTHHANKNSKIRSYQHFHN